MEPELFIFLQLNYLFFSMQNTSRIILQIKKVKKCNFFLYIRLHFLNLYLLNLMHY